MNIFISKRPSILSFPPSVCVLTVVLVQCIFLQISFTEEDRRDPYKTFHKMSLAEFFDQYFNKSFTKSEFLASIKSISANSSFSDAVTWNMTVNVVNPNYYRRLDEMLAKRLSAPDGSGKRFLANYLGWRSLLNAAGQLSKRFRDATFEFDKAYSGVKEESPRWRTCVEYTNSAVKLAIGSIYVDAYFGMDAKAKVRIIGSHIRGGGGLIEV